jgi:hypothetical protein
MEPITGAALSAAVEAVFKATTKLLEIVMTNPPKRPSGVSPNGDWAGRWTVQQPKRYRPKNVEDIITLKVARNGRVTGSGRNAHYGRFHMTGADSTYAMALTYSGEGSSANHPGVCLLIKSPDGSRMDGVWWQFRSDAPLVGGTVTMKRIP